MSELTGAARSVLLTRRAASTAGIVFGVLLGTASIVLRLTLGSDPVRIEAFAGPGRSAIVFALALLPFAGIAFLWFIGVVRDRVGPGEDRFFATVFLGSGLIFVAAMFVTGALGGALLAAADTGVSLDDGVWTFGQSALNTLWTVYATRMAAVFTLSTTSLGMRLAIVPRWMVVHGLATALLLLLLAGPVQWIELVFPVWVLTFSTHGLIMTFRSPPTGDASVVPGGDARS